MKKGQNLLSKLSAGIVLVLCGAICGLVSVVYLDGVFEEYGFLLSWVFKLALFLVAYFVQTVIHEAGHLIAGLISGYSFGSFRIGSFMLVKEENGRFKIKRQSLAGTGGQCLMTPPAMVNGKYPVIFYNLGGALLNFMTLPICVLLLSRCIGKPLAHALCVTMFLAGLIIVMTNGIPLKLAMINNDGANAIELARSAESRLFFHNQFMIIDGIRKGLRLKDMDMDLFPMPSEKGMQKSISASGAVFLENRLMDEGKFDEALELTNKLLSSKNAIVGLHKGLLIADKIFILLLVKGDIRGAKSLYSSKFYQTFKKQMKNNISVLRTDIAYSMLLEVDEYEAREFYEKFKKVALNLPYECELVGELEFLDKVAKKYAESNDVEAERIEEVFDLINWDKVEKKSCSNKKNGREKIPKWMVILVAFLTLALVFAAIIIIEQDRIYLLPEKDPPPYYNTGVPAPKDDVGGVDYTVIDGVKYEFVSDDEKTVWVDAIAALISNMKVTEAGDPFGFGTPALDENAPSIENSSYFALFDVNFDGVPELLAEPKGSSGSNGFRMYCVYDIYSGDFLGEIHGKGDGSIAVYYDKTMGVALNIAFSSIRGGYFSRNEFVSQIECDQFGACSENTWFSYHVEIYHDYLDDGSCVEWQEISYGVHDEYASYDEYSSLYTYFMLNFVRIPETEIVFYHDSSLVLGCDYEAKGLEIANALIEGMQKIIKPSN